MLQGFLCVCDGKDFKSQFATNNFLLFLLDSQEDWYHKTVSFARRWKSTCFIIDIKFQDYGVGRRRYTLLVQSQICGQILLFEPPHILQDVGGSILPCMKTLNDSCDISYNERLILLISKKTILNLCLGRMDMEI